MNKNTRKYLKYIGFHNRPLDVPLQYKIINHVGAVSDRPLILKI